jgi:hypothetical protein
VQPDPIADWRRIGGGYRAGHIGRWIFVAIFVDGPCSVKAEHSPPCDTDAVTRNDNQDERASGKAGAIDDDLLAGLSKLLEKLEKGASLAAGAGFDPHLGQSRRQRDDEKQNSTKSAPHWDIVLAAQGDTMKEFLCTIPREAIEVLVAGRRQAGGPP